jgi:mannose-6-phosphate isomerase-like protein (cupin superfamily)
VKNVSLDKEHRSAVDPREEIHQMRVVRASEGEFVPASHEDPNQPGVLKRVIATRDEMLNGRVQMMNWVRLPVGSSFRAHYHEDMQEAFIILRGQVVMCIDQQEVEMEAGDTLIVDPREVHTMKNLCAEEVEYIVVGISLGQNGRTVVVESGDRS